MSKNFITTVSCLLLVSASHCMAQTDRVTTTFGVKRYNHASTYQQSVLDGMANFVGARSQAHYYHNLARLTNERVREARMANQMAKVKNHYARKETRRDYMAKKLARKRELYVQRIHSTQARRRAPQMGHEQAAIAWPTSLKTASYVSHRLQLESLCKLKEQLASTGSGFVQAGIQYGLRDLAKKVVEDERAGRLNHSQSTVIRSFVRDLHRNMCHTQPNANRKYQPNHQIVESDVESADGAS